MGMRPFHTGLVIFRNLQLRRNRRAGQDPERSTSFYVTELDAASPATGATVLAGPIQAPADEYIPVADGVFNYDGVSKIWFTFWLNKLPHVNACVTYTASTAGASKGAIEKFYSRPETGYIESFGACAPGLLPLSVKYCSQHHYINMYVVAWHWSNIIILLLQPPGTSRQLWQRRRGKPGYEQRQLGVGVCVWGGGG